MPKKSLIYLLIAFSILYPSLMGSQNAQITAQSQTPSKDISPPEFTITYVDRSYDVPTTYSIDRYTGDNVTHEGYHVYNSTFELSIKNALINLTPADYIVYYNVRFKGHFDIENWTTCYVYSPRYVTYYSNETVESRVNCLQASDAEYTTVSVPATAYPPDAQIDVQVQTLVYSRTSVWIYESEFSGYGNYYPALIQLKVSDWSSTQTVAIPEKVATPESTAMPSLAETTLASATTPEQMFPASWLVLVQWALIFAAVGVASLALLVALRKNRKRE
jgi:hypothetical protein